MTQIRKPDGKFGGRAADITPKDVHNAIVLINDEVNVDVKIALKKPVRVNMNANASVTHHLGTLEYALYATVTICILVITIIGGLYLLSRI
jgi:hypothetical protein